MAEETQEQKDERMSWELFPDIKPQADKEPVHPVVRMTAMAEENGKLKALYYVSGWINYHLAKDNINAAYIAAMVDLKVNVQAAIQRTIDGQPMESTSEFVKAV